MYATNNIKGLKRGGNFKDLKIGKDLLGKASEETSLTFFVKTNARTQLKLIN